MAADSGNWKASTNQAPELDRWLTNAIFWLRLGRAAVCLAGSPSWYPHDRIVNLGVSAQLLKQLIKCNKSPTLVLAAIFEILFVALIEIAVDSFSWFWPPEAHLVTIDCTWEFFCITYICKSYFQNMFQEHEECPQQCQ